MFAPTDKRVSRWQLALAILLLGAQGLAAQPAQRPEPPVGSVVLRASAQEELARFQRDWLDWLTACNEDDREAASEAVARLLSRARLVGMESLPRLSVAAAAQAVEFAAAGASERARWALDAAEALDPGRPESAFAQAAVARHGGRQLVALGASVRGALRQARAGLGRWVLVYDVLLWAASLAVLLALAYIALQMIARGPWLYRELLSIPIRFAPLAVAHVLALAALLWPLLLPSGLLWTAFYWSLLLWIYCERRERLLFVAGWLLVALLPIAALEVGRRVERSLSAPVAAIEEAALGRLEGTLFSHLGDLSARLPDSVAARQFVADAHRKVGQCDIARRLYEQVLAAEPDNVDAMVDLGACHFDAGNYGRAIGLFRRAASGQAPAASVQFNLSQAYSELYRFEESEAALRTAQQLDATGVSRWLASGGARRIVPADGGLKRSAEIREEAARDQEADGLQLEASELGRRMLPLPPLAVLLVVAVGLQLAIRSFGTRARRPLGAWWPGGADLWRRALLPGVPEAEEGHWRPALLLLAAALVFATVPFFRGLGLSLPFALRPDSGVLTTVALSGFAALVVARALRELRR